MLNHDLKVLNYFIYRHIRVDKNEPFYIGVGTKPKENWNTYNREYKRAFDTKCGRSNHWMNINSITTVTVEIIYETNDYKEALHKEIEFISLYKRKSNGGTLINLTDGGEGVKGVNVSEVTRNKLSIINTGKKLSEEHKAKISKAHMGKQIPQSTKDALTKRGYETFGENHASSILSEKQVLNIINLFNGGEKPVKIAQRYPLVKKHTINRILIKKSWKHLSNLINDEAYIKLYNKDNFHLNKKVLNILTGEIIPSIAELSRRLQKPENTVRNWFKTNRKHKTDYLLIN